MVAVTLPSAPATATTSQQVPVCKRAPHARVGCFAIRLDRYSSGRIRHASAPVGYSPEDLQTAYALPSGDAGDGMTVAVVDAYDDPAAESDLATYRKEFGLPSCTSTAASARSTRAV